MSVSPGPIASAVILLGLSYYSCVVVNKTFVSLQPCCRPRFRAFRPAPSGDPRPAIPVREAPVRMSRAPYHGIARCIKLHDRPKCIGGRQVRPPPTGLVGTLGASRRRMGQESLARPDGILKRRLSAGRHRPPLPLRVPGGRAVHHGVE